MWLNLSDVSGEVTVLDLGQAYRPGFLLNLKGNSFSIVNSYAGLEAVTSLDARGSGRAMTRPLVFTGKRLVLNVAAKGSVRVGIAQQDGNLIPGFSIEDCKPINADFLRTGLSESGSVSHEVSWKHGSDISNLAGKTVRLLLKMQNAKLYALQFKK